MHFLALGMLFPGDQTYVVIATLLFTLHLLGFNFLDLFRTSETLSEETSTSEKSEETKKKPCEEKNSNISISWKL